MVCGHVCFKFFAVLIALINFEQQAVTTEETSGVVILTLLNNGTGTGTVCEYLTRFINYLKVFTVVWTDEHPKLTAVNFKASEWLIEVKQTEFKSML